MRPFDYSKKDYLLGEGGAMVNKATSEKQRRLMGAALSMKRGQAKPKGGAAKLAKSMSEEDLRDFAKKPKKKAY